MSLSTLKIELRNKLVPDVTTEICDLYRIEGRKRGQLINDNSGNEIIYYLESEAKIDNVQSLFEFRDELQIGVALGFSKLKQLATDITKYLNENKIEKEEAPSEGSALTDNQLLEILNLSKSRKTWDTESSFDRQVIMHNWAREVRNLSNQQLVHIFQIDFKSQLSKEILILLVDFLNSRFKFTPQEYGDSTSDKGNKLCTILHTRGFINSIENITTKFRNLLAKVNEDDRFDGLSFLYQWLEQWIATPGFRSMNQSELAANIESKSFILMKKDLKRVKEANKFIIHPLCTDGINEGIGDKLVLERVLEFLNQSKKKVLLILGNAGSGKSTCCQMILRFLWDRYNSTEIGKGEIPLFASLPTIHSPSTSIVSEIFERNAIVDKNEQLWLKENRIVHFILDGYDELYSQVRLFGQTDLDQFNGKIIISCRTESLPVLKLLTPPHSEIMKIYLTPFTETQVLEYITNQAIDPNNFQKLIESIPSLKEFIQTPVHLKIICEILPEISQKLNDNRTVNRFEIYDLFVRNRINQSIQHHVGPLQHLNTLKLTLRQLPNAVIQQCIEWSIQMRNQKSKYLSFNMTESEIDKDLRSLAGLDTKEQILRWLSPLLLEEDGDIVNCKFIDATIGEFFLVYQLNQILSESKSAPEKQLNEIKKHPIFSELLGISTWQFISDLIKSNQKLKAEIWSLIELSKKSEEFSILAANCASIWNICGFSFSGKDLREIKIPGAFLNRANFFGTDLRNANLKGCHLKDTNFVNANLEGADLRDAIYELNPQQSTFLRLGCKPTLLRKHRHLNAMVILGATQLVSTHLSITSVNDVLIRFNSNLGFETFLPIDPGTDVSTSFGLFSDDVSFSVFSEIPSATAINITPALFESCRRVLLNGFLEVTNSNITQLVSSLKPLISLPDISSEKILEPVKEIVISCMNTDLFVPIWQLPLAEKLAFQLTLDDYPWISELNDKNAEWNMIYRPSDQNLTDLTTNFCDLLKNLTNLKSLDLSFSPFCLSDNVKQILNSVCESIEMINLSGYNPSCSLTRLDIKRIGFEEKIIKSIKSIDFGPIFSKFKSLCSVGLSWTDDDGTVLKQIISSCSQLKQLEMRHTKLTNCLDIQYLLQNCKSLTSLDLSGCEISGKISQESPISSHLLDLRCNNVKADASLFRELLRFVDFANVRTFQIGSFASQDYLEHFSNNSNFSVLENLAITSVPLRELPTISLRTISVLNLKQTNMTEISLVNILKQTTDLIELDLSTIVPPIGNTVAREIKTSKLLSLKLNDSAISMKVLEEILSTCPQLQTLHLDNTEKLTCDFLRGLKKETSMKELCVSGISIDQTGVDLFGTQCPSLERLNLSGSNVNLELLDSLLKSIRTLKQLSIMQCPNLTNPPRELLRSRLCILEYDIIRANFLHPLPLIAGYLKDLTESETVDLNTIKLVFVGESGAGKSTLFEAFKKCPRFWQADEKESTEVFELAYETWPVEDSFGNETTLQKELEEHFTNPETPKQDKDLYFKCIQDSCKQNDSSAATKDKHKVNFRIFDMAGQEDYHVFQSFMSGKGCLFLLVVDLRKWVKPSDDSIKNLRNWLELIQIRSPQGAQVILVGTHKDAVDLHGNNSDQAISKLNREIGFWKEKRKDALKEYQTRLESLAEQNNAKRGQLYQKIQRNKSFNILTVFEKVVVSAKYGTNVWKLRNCLVSAVQSVEPLSKFLEQSIPTLYQSIQQKVLKFNNQNIGDCLSQSEFLEEVLNVRFSASTKPTFRAFSKLSTPTSQTKNSIQKPVFPSGTNISDPKSTPTITPILSRNEGKQEDVQQPIAEVSSTPSPLVRPLVRTDALLTILHELSFVFCFDTKSFDRIFVRPGRVANVIKSVVSYKQPTDRSFNENWESSWDENNDGKPIGWHITEFQKGLVCSEFLRHCLLNNCEDVQQFQDSNAIKTFKTSLIQLMCDLQVLIPIQHSQHEEKSQKDPTSYAYRMYLAPSKVDALTSAEHSTKFRFQRQMRFNFLPTGFFFQLQVWLVINHHKSGNPKFQLEASKGLLIWTDVANQVKCEIYQESTNCSPGFIEIGINFPKEKNSHLLEFEILEKIDEAIESLSEEQWIGLEKPIIKYGKDQKLMSELLKINVPSDSDKEMICANDLRTNFSHWVTIPFSMNANLDQKIDPNRVCGFLTSELRDYLALNIFPQNYSAQEDFCASATKAFKYLEKQKYFSNLDQFHSFIALLKKIPGGPIMAQYLESLIEQN